MQLIVIIEMPNKLKKVYELEGLVCDLHAHFTAESGSMMGISKPKATELLSSTIFDYELNSRYVMNPSLLMVANTKTCKAKSLSYFVVTPYNFVFCFFF